MSVFLLKEGVCHCQLVEGAQFKESLAILIHFANSMMTDDRRPGFAVRSNPCVEVSHDEECFLAGYTTDYGVKGIVELVLLIFGGA